MIFFTIILGAILGGLLGEILGMALPEGVVKEFFLSAVKPGFDFGPVDLIVIKFQFSLHIVLNFASLLGMGIAYYFLRYFR